MNRRSLFTSWYTRPSAAITDQRPPVRPQSSGLEPYVPSAAMPWDAERVGHLLRRATFMPTWTEINMMMAVTPSQAVDQLLNAPSQPQAPGIANNVTESLDGLDITLQNQVKAQWGADMANFRSWYVNVIQNAGLTLVEKMAFFWSGHFTSQFELADDIIQAPLMYRQNQLFRDRAFANLKDLVMDITLDGAMLVYLGGDLNNASAPNENYGREVLELYTTGLGQYTEGDVQNAARILTGWRIARFSDKPAPNGMFTTYFDAKNHDIDGKEFMTISFPARDVSTNTEFIVKRDEVRKLVDTIFEQRQRAVAEFICRKIYRFFVYSNPAATDEAVISAMADLFIANSFEIKPVMSALLKSAHFFDNANIGAQIKTPAEFEVGLARVLHGGRDVAGDMKLLDQELFNPPNVSGWPGYRSWITTTTFPVRADVSHGIISAMSDDAAVAFAKGLPDNTDVTKLTVNIAAVLLPRPLSDQRLANLKTKLIGAAPDYEWPDIINGSPAGAGPRIRDLLSTIVDLPDFQLC
ncbi:MAG TPA: DUF1800 domain-containing protein [Candidatus Kapabacteria bacterium]|nr:DUF1800 domain-containing protein [Candidatus Kapabacteria bacterium]